MNDAQSILDRLEAIAKRAEQEKEEALRPIKSRLAEIDRQRAELDAEEAKLTKILRDMGQGGPAPVKRRRSSGRRMTSRHKSEIVATYIRDGHIKDGMSLTKELRAALTDTGFGNHDFRKLPEYMPPGWEAKSNGMRGNAAKTTFHKV